MHIPLSWLKESIDIDLSPEEIANLLTLAGLEVDGIKKVSLSATGVVVAKIIESEKHPEADQLSIAKVTDGKEVYQVVCGAPNCRAGIKVALAKIDATLIDDGKSFKIKKAKLRGVESFGMLCSAKELGISEESDGILELGEDLVEGTDLSCLYEDIIFEISLTPNLGHCSSVLGIARELSAATNIPLKPIKIEVHEDEKRLASSLIEVKVSNTTDCPKYACRVMTDVTVGNSPDWLKKRLAACGIRSINNIVDVTNYVMLELGHPLHAFDKDRLGSQIIVKNPNKGETFVTLDGKTRILEDSDIVISSANEALALAGIMGGQNSEVHDATKNIVLEAACFSPSSIRKTSKRLGMSTDASKKFERGCDPNILTKCLDRAAMLIQQTAGGSILKGVIDAGLKDFPKKTINCRLKRINTVLGTHLKKVEVADIFKRLEFVTQIVDDETFSVQVPTYRNDLKEEIDLVEEVARIYGFGNIVVEGVRYRSSEIQHDKMFLFEREIRTRILREGLQEFLTCDLIGPTLLEIVGKNNYEINAHTVVDHSYVQVTNPTSIEQSILRNTVLPGLLQVVKYNIDHQNPDISGFEIGRIHFKDAGNYVEQSVLGIVMCGKSRPHHYDQKPQNVDFFDLKGVIENLLGELKVKNISFKESKILPLHPGRQTAIYSGDLLLGIIGEVHPAVQRRLDVTEKILFAEINLHNLSEVSTANETMKPLPIFPGSERDLTLTLKESVPVESVFQAVREASSKHLESLSLIDVYRSDKLGANLKNVTFRFFYRDLESTMSQEKVDKEHARIVQSVSNKI